MADDRATQTSLAPGQRLEPVHLHGVQDTSVHLVLPRERGEELVRLGWAEAHQHAEFGTEYMMYGPRDADELDAVVSVVEESLTFARHAAEQENAKEQPPPETTGPISAAQHRLA